MRPQGTTRPPKWPFFMGDAALVVVAIAIGYVEQGPLSDTAIVLIFLCVFLGAALAVTPFFLDFSAARHEDLIEARSQLEALAQRISESSDFMGTVAGQLHSLHEATLKSIHTAEALPYKIQEKVGELAQIVREGDDDEKEAMAAEIEELRDAEGRHIHTEIEKARTALEAAVKRVEAAENALSAATTALAASKAAPPFEGAPKESPAKSATPPRAKKDSHQEPTSARTEESAPEPDASSGGGHSRAKHRESAKSAKHERSVHATKSEDKHDSKAEQTNSPDKKHIRESAAPPRKKVAQKPPADEILPGLDPVVVRDEDVDGEEGGAAKTSDGSTRLLVTAYIGIGNKVFVRGDGPGLDAEKGQPMEFVSIGKWLWQTSEATAPVTLQLYKNDEVKAMGDDITIDPGYHVEVTPVFRDTNPF